MFKWERVDLNAPSDRADFIKQWALKLVDPAMKQTKGKLARNNGSRCCLGVASCNVANLKTIKDEEHIRSALIVGEDESTEVLPDELSSFLKMEESGMVLSGSDRTLRQKVEITLNTTLLAEANDRGVPFLTIAKVITEYPTAFFRDLTPEEETYIMNVRPTLPTREKLRAQKKELKRASGENQGQAE